MKIRSQITCASLALLIVGSSLLYTTPTSIIKAEPTQNVSSSLQTNTQRDHTFRQASNAGYIATWIPGDTC